MCATQCLVSADWQFATTRGHLTEHLRAYRQNRCSTYRSKALHISSLLNSGVEALRALLESDQVPLERFMELEDVVDGVVARPETSLGRAGVSPNLHSISLQEHNSDCYHEPAQLAVCTRLGVCPDQ